MKSPNGLERDPNLIPTCLERISECRSRRNWRKSTRLRHQNHQMAWKETRAWSLGVLEEYLDIDLGWIEGKAPDCTFGLLMIWKEKIRHDPWVSQNHDGFNPWAKDRAGGWSQKLRRCQNRTEELQMTSLKHTHHEIWVLDKIKQRVTWRLWLNSRYSSTSAKGIGG